jgi:DNA polymerase I-like protein with 3'-5' exonuclease and polymerase domains
MTWVLARKIPTHVDGIPLMFVDSSEKVERALRMLEDSEKVGLDTEYYGHIQGDESPYGKCKPVSMQLTCKGAKVSDVHWGKQIFVPNYGDKKYIKHFRKWLASDKKQKVLHNAKADFHPLANIACPVNGFLGDTMVKAFMMMSAGEHGLKPLMMKHFKVDSPDYADTFRLPKQLKDGSPGKQTRIPSANELVDGSLDWYHGNTLKKLIDYSVKDPRYTVDLDDELDSQLRDTEWVGGKSMYDYYHMVEREFTEVLFSIERTGCYLDLEAAEDLKGKFEEIVIKSERAFFREAVRLGIKPAYLQELSDSCKGKNGLMGSDQKLGDLFVNKLGFKLPLTESGRPSVKAENLAAVVNDKNRAMIGAFLQWAEVSDKLLGTYVYPLIRMAKDPAYGGYIYTTLKQIGALSGRLACVAEWTPIDTERGKVAISELKVGDTVTTHLGNQKRVLDVFTKGYDHMFDLTLSNGETLTCTADHRLLIVDGTWVPVGELIRVHLEKVGSLEEQSRERVAAVSIEGDAHYDADCGEVRDNVPQREPRADSLHAEAREGSPGQGQILEFEDRLSQPYEGQEREEASQLERRVQGRQRVLDVLAQWEAAVRSQSCHDEGARLGRTSSEVGRSSHRRGSEEQQPRQPGSSDSQRTPDVTLFAGRGFPGVEIEEVHYRGRLEVHDMTVEDDHSYLACGVLSHNSEAPNLQNIPIRTELGRMIRKLFGVTPGQTFIDVDQSQIELRVAAHQSKDKVMLDAYARGIDLHSRTAMTSFEEVERAVAKQFMGGTFSTEKVNTEIGDWVKANFKDFRNNGKTVNFLVLYGGSGKRYAVQTGASPEEGDRVIKQFFKTYPGIRANISKVLDGLHKTGYVRSAYLRRYIHFPDIVSNKKWIVAAAERSAYNATIQGGAGDLMKLAMIAINRCEKLKNLGCQMQLQVHDELCLRAPNESVAKASPLITKYVSRPFDSFGMKQLLLDTPAELQAGKNWLETH